ncbi:MAG: phage virion morphogenesis protein [Bacteroidetes bacterium]|nr:phage virion morphogenesis protein [Bacteroidota bacterium]
MKSKIQIPDFSKMAESTRKQIPPDIGQIALSHFKESFHKGGFTASSFVAWSPRKHDTGYPILRKTNALMESLKVAEETMQRIKIETTLPYAAIHNNGGKFSVRVTPKMRKYFWAMYKATGQERWKFMALTKKKRLPIRIPERKFIGESRVLLDKIDRHIAELIAKEIVNTFKNG